MTLAGIEEEVLGGVILAIVLWCAGAIFQWLVNRNRQITSLRKYERLRAKVEVLSQLATVQVSTFENSGLERRHQDVMRNELTSLLDELEQDERDAIEVTQLAKVLGTFSIGPSRTITAVLVKALHYGVSFFALCIISFLVILVIDPPIISGKTEPVPILGAICLCVPLVMLMFLTYYLALRVHRKQFVEAKVVSTGEC